MQPPQQNTCFAHSGKAEDGSDWQTLSEHLEATAARAAAAGHPVGLPRCASTAARFHDFGKYDPAFQRRLSGDKATVDHSTAGAHLLLDRAGPMPHAAQLLAYAILGHHAGLPDKTGSQAAMDARIAGFRDPVPAAITAAQQVEVEVARRRIHRPGDQLPHGALLPVFVVAMEEVRRLEGLVHDRLPQLAEPLGTHGGPI